jgi:predicted extracellular nuclease
VIRKLGSALYPNDYARGDFNPERIQLDHVLVPGSTPAVNVNDRFTTPAVGVLDYNFGNFEVLLTSALTRVDRGLKREVTRAQRRGELAVATFNVENLDPTDPPAKFAALAGLIVNNLRAPDLLAIEEIQDNTGPAAADASTDASVTWQMLIAAIETAGGPTYDYRQIDPLFNQDGGEPGGNIRVGFLFRTDRGLSFVDRPGGTAVNATHEDTAAPGAQLTLSPGRVDPTNTAFTSSRKPLAGEFRWRGKTFFAVANHFNSKGGDHPLFGRFQPPLRSSETQRHQQAAIVNAFVDELLAADKRARIIVLGDINDFEFSTTTAILEGGVLTSLVDTLPRSERYTYVFEGNSQVLDQILVSKALLSGDDDDDTRYDVVHVNAEFAAQDSDHDPSVMRTRFDDDDDRGDRDDDD